MRKTLLTSIVALCVVLCCMFVALPVRADVVEVPDEPLYQLTQEEYDQLSDYIREQYSYGTLYYSGDGLLLDEYGNAVYDENSQVYYKDNGGGSSVNTDNPPVSNDDDNDQQQVPNDADASTDKSNPMTLLVPGVIVGAVVAAALIVWLSRKNKPANKIPAHMKSNR